MIPRLYYLTILLNRVYFNMSKNYTTVNGALRGLIKKHGFSEIISEIGVEAKRAEDIIKRDNDRTLGNCFEMTFIFAMEYFAKMNKRDADFFKKLVLSDSYQEALKMIGWDSETQSGAMKKIRQKILSWQTGE